MTLKILGPFRLGGRNFVEQTAPKSNRKNKLSNSQEDKRSFYKHKRSCKRSTDMFLIKSFFVKNGLYLYFRTFNLFYLYKFLTFFELKRDKWVNLNWERNWATRISEAK